MPKAEVHQCQGPHGQQDAAPPDQALHYQMNLLLSRLDEQQRRWYAAVESNRLGHGGDQLVAALAERPTDRVRLPGAGRPRAEKKRSPPGHGPAADRDARNGGGFQ